MKMIDVAKLSAFLMLVGTLLFSPTTAEENNIKEKSSKSTLTPDDEKEKMKLRGSTTWRIQQKPFRP